MEEMEALAERAGALARERLRHAQPELVNSLFWYGAVYIDPKYLVVWVMLNGPADELPTWFFPSRIRETDEPLAFGLLDKLYLLEQLVQDAFAEAGWPLAPVDVGFESDERARANGGWNYFR